ncbi:MAG: hypothetical protein LBL75_02870 [Rickettsiales bacterium]|jgi:hypothetical protein|nr:hypothetical protein [Rickettsiales bacterium]
MLKYDNDSLIGFTKDLSDTEQAKANHSIEMVKEAIDDYDWKAAELNCPVVKLKGSYHNKTNVRIDSDVDIYVLFDGHFLIDTPKQCISPDHKGGGKSCEYHRKHLEKALKERFGDQVRNGKKAFKIKETSYKHESDVVGAIPAKDDKYINSRDGIMSFFNDQVRSLNYPLQDKNNSDLKDAMSLGYYKQMVRIFKGIKNDLNYDIPSFLIECMVYNVDNSLIMDSSKNYLGKARNIVEAWSRYLRTNPSSFVELNEIKLLFSSIQKWTIDDAKAFTEKMIEVLW